MVRQNRAASGTRETAQLREIIIVCLCLTAVTWLVFGQSLGHDFVNYDDNVYVYQNELVKRGLTAHGFVSAFTQTHARNWHPLTTISHMLDTNVFGMSAGGHHFTNVFLHTLAVLSLFLVLQQMTHGPRRSGNIWRSAFVAAVFAIHPLHVESVAWIAERKDVLSALFFMLTLGAYASYARKPSLGGYFTLTILFACGLMSKPMLVTVPLILLLLDYWPLNRGQKPEVGSQRPGWSRRALAPDAPPWTRLIIEKIPLFALSIACGIVTFLIQKRTLGSIAPLPIGWRLSNAIFSYVTYIGQMFWPVDLAAFYPHPEGQLPLWQILAALAFIVATTALVLALRRTRPYLLVGWLWYLIMLLPVIGIVQVGLQGHADRYTYLPQIGLYVALTWLVADLFGSLRYRRQILAVLAIALIAALSACARKQVTYWKNSVSLWTHALAVSSDNEVAQANMGTLLLEHGQIDEAIAHLQKALRIHSDSDQAHYHLSLALIHTDLGNALLRKGQSTEAVAHYEKAIALEPDYPDAYYNLGTLFFQKGQLDDAIRQWNKTLSLRPSDADAHTSLGNAFLQKGLLRGAIAHYEAALVVAPPSTLALNNLAWILATCPDATIRNGRRAIELARRAVQLSDFQNPIFIRTLAAAFAEIGRFEEATETAERAVQLARTRNDSELAEEIEKSSEHFRAHAPLRDNSLTDAEPKR